jgi:hypothetical protein
MPVWPKAKIGKPAETEENNVWTSNRAILQQYSRPPKLLNGPSIGRRQSTDKFNRTNAVDTNWNKGRHHCGRRQQSRENPWPRPLQVRPTSFVYRNVKRQCGMAVKAERTRRVATAGMWKSPDPTKEKSLL